MDKEQITIAEFERKVQHLEEVKIVIRTGEYITVNDYHFKRCAKDNMTVGVFLRTRIRECLGRKPDGTDYEISVIGGNYTNVHPRTTLKTVRESYRR